MSHDSAWTNPNLLPRLGDCVHIHRPVEPGSPWVLQRGTKRYFRVSEAVGLLAEKLDGSMTAPELAISLGPPWTPPLVEQVLSRFRDAGILDDETPHRYSRVRFSPPMTIQLTLLDPSRVLTPALPVIRTLAGRTAGGLAAAIVLAGILVLAGATGEIRETLSRPQPLGVYGGVAIGALLTTALHEFGHGAVLTHHGGSPTRMGVMLFYLAPAFFCDVSDGWRLPHPWQRVQVAMAGVATQVVVGGLAALTIPLTPMGPLRAGIVLFATVMLASAALNLLPFVKFDGYIALMSHLDKPGLRDRAMTDARRAVARVLFGGRYAKELGNSRWAVPYGIGCIAFPAYLILQAAALWIDLVAALGWGGTVAVLLVVAGITSAVVRGGVRLGREALIAGAPPWRIVAGLAGVAGGALLLASHVHVPLEATGGYFTDSHGQVHVVLPVSTDSRIVEEERDVVFETSGIALRDQVGTGRLDSTSPHTIQGPLAAVTPFPSDLTTVFTSAYVASVDAPLQYSVGRARVIGPEVTLIDWIASTHLRPAL